MPIKHIKWFFSNCLIGKNRLIFANGIYWKPQHGKLKRLENKIIVKIDKPKWSHREDLLCHRLQISIVHASVHKKKNNVNKILQLIFYAITYILGLNLKYYLVLNIHRLSWKKIHFFLIKIYVAFCQICFHLPTNTPCIYAQIFENTNVVP